VDDGGVHSLDGPAIGTENWTTGPILLIPGPENQIVITATDNYGNATSVAVSVIKKPGIESEQPDEPLPEDDDKPDALDLDEDFYLNADETACGSDPDNFESVPDNYGLTHGGAPNQYPDKIKTDKDGNVLGNYLLPDCLNDDDDQDGINDVCEMQIIEAEVEDAISTIADVAADDDFDGDGFTNFLECQNGTDPTAAPDGQFQLSVLDTAGQQVYNSWLPGYRKVLKIQARWDNEGAPATAVFQLEGTSSLKGRAENDPEPVENTLQPLASVAYETGYQYYGLDFGLTQTDPATDANVQSLAQGPIAVSGTGGVYTIYLHSLDYGGRTKVVVTHPTLSNIRNELWIPEGSGDSGIGSAWQYDSDVNNRLAETDDKDGIISENWQLQEIDLAPYAEKTVRFAFYHEAARDHNNHPSESSGWLIDEIRTVLKEPNEDDVEADIGWADWMQDNAGSMWQIGTLALDPGIGPRTCYQPTPDKYDSLCAATVLGGDYAAETDSRLISSPLPLPAVNGQQELYLRFVHWYSYAMLDSATVQISYDEGGGLWSDWQDIAGFKNHTPAAASQGDDFNNFEEYRGIIYGVPVGGAGEMEFKHMRLNPYRQDLFVRAVGYDDAIGDPYRPFTPAADYDDYYPFRLGLALKNAGVDVHNTTGWGHDATADGSFFAYYTDGTIGGMRVSNKIIEGSNNGWATHWPKREWEFKMAADVAAPWVPITSWDSYVEELTLALPYTGPTTIGAYLIRKPLPHINTVIVRHDRTSPAAVSNKDGYINFLKAIPPGFLNADGTRIWQWDQKGHASTNPTADHPTMYGYATTYQVPLDHYFGDRPYIEGTVWTGSGFTPAPVPDGKLAPLSEVEDQFDAMTPIDGALDNVADEFWDGDYRTADEIEWYNALNRVGPFDIDSNGYVELPAATNPVADNYDKQHDLKGIPYTRARVLTHTASHEMVHAIAGPPHSLIETCMMYEFSNSWNRDDFISEEIRILLRIHNIKR